MANVSDHLDPNDTTWLFLDHIDTLIFSKHQLEFPLNFGRILSEMFERGQDYNIKSVFELFTINKVGITFPLLSHLYTLVDFGQFGSNKMFEESKFYDLANLDVDFKRCFKHMYEKYYANSTSSEETIENEVNESPTFMMPSPCSVSKEKCLKYCKWHSDILLKSLPSKEFLALMKLSLPQPSLKQNPLSLVEKRLFEEILGKANVGTVTSPFLGMALVIFCKDKSSQRWQGAYANMYPKICQDFHYSPTEKGICVTKNSKVNDFLNIHSDYNQLFDQGHFQAMKVQGSRFEAKATFVLDTNALQRVKRTFSKSARVLNDLVEEEYMNADDISEVHLQIHSPNELAKFAKDPGQKRSLDSIILKPNNVYTIRVNPIKRDITEEFKNLDENKRKCLLKTEIQINSSLKEYNLPNCIYECKTNHAVSICKCCPWDFPLCYKKSSECDVFGRTCFNNFMYNMMHDLEELCPYCRPTCEEIDYDRTIEDKQLIISSSNTWYTESKYFSPYGDACTRKDFCDFILDRNNTIEPLTWYEILSNKSSLLKKDRGIAVAKDMIIVNIEFDSPHLETIILDTRYSMIDRIAGLGGSLGIFGQITGASFITLVHLSILICCSFKSSLKTK